MRINGLVVVSNLFFFLARGILRFPQKELVAFLSASSRRGPETTLIRAIVDPRDKGFSFLILLNPKGETVIKRHKCQRTETDFLMKLKEKNLLGKSPGQPFCVVRISS